MDQLLSPAAGMPRPPSVNSTDLELEDVVPREALSPHYVHSHMTPVEFEQKKPSPRGAVGPQGEGEVGFMSIG